MKVVVTGDRHWTDFQRVFDTLDMLLWSAAVSGDDMFVVIEGECPTGADRHAAQWAIDRQRTHERPRVILEGFPARWHEPPDGRGVRKYRPWAGPERNRQMLAREPDVVVGFHDSIEFSRGTRDCMEAARQLGMEVWLVTHNDRRRY